MYIAVYVSVVYLICCYMYIYVSITYSILMFSEHNPVCEAREGADGGKLYPAAGYLRETSRQDGRNHLIVRAGSDLDHGAQGFQG